MERPSVSSIVLSALAVLSVAVGASARPGHVWTVIAVDPLGDGREPAGFDAAQLSYQYDKSADRLWLRLALFELPKVDEFKVLNGTPARPLPPETSSAGDFTWTRRLERDIVNLIALKHLDKPIIVAHGFPGTLAAEELASLTRIS